ncbi:hypothetical protein [Actinacidiphila paucisporea]|uniref:Antibiotic biosynthesis monooxygenase n=1 Tax=Actinacidiphila paucisporea TaxID=310782 RepID=A0A1M6YTY8_9ACTN|nr:hypothetical protein [Actinacidiphila paucisporea]SHL21553.1 hypothetical protein SAMN05216499_103116 [Actinacidiphila paucisporea]
MSNVAIVRYQTRPGAAAENQRLVEAVMAELNEQDPGGLRYAAFRLDDGVTFLHVAVTGDADSPLDGSAAFAAFQQGFADRLVPGTRSRDTATAVGSYGFLPGAPRP